MSAETALYKEEQEKQFQKELDRLNPEQLKAVTHLEGPVMVIAGPGTGKTQILAARIGNILRSDLQVAPHNILCLTYTDAGTIAMRKRLISFIGPTAYRVNIYTFHAFCNDIIQYNPDYFGRKEMQPVSDLEAVQILRELLDDLPVDHTLKRLKGELYFDVPRLRSLFQTMKEEDWDEKYVSDQIDHYLNDLPNRDEFLYKRGNSKKGIKVGDVKQNEIDKKKEVMENLRAAASLFPVYCKMMKQRARYDYSDMILWVLNAFKQDENFLRSYQEWYQYFLIDEFQDTSGAQNELLNLLTGFWDKPNVFTVGDDDQCIFEFQGARVKNMTAFFERYEKDIEVVILKENYRSVQSILDASKAVIDNNAQRLVNQAPLMKKIPGLSKTLQSNTGEEKLPQPEIIEYHNSVHELADIIEKIGQLRSDGFDLSKVAVIYARHKQGNELIEMLEKKGIPYSAKKRINILELPLISQLLNILGYLNDESKKPHSGEHRLFEIMHYHFIGLSARDAARISVHCGKEYKRWRDVLADYDTLKTLHLDNYGSVIFFEESITRWIAETANSTLQLLFERILNWSGLLKQVLHSPDKIFELQIITSFFNFIKSECAKKPDLSLREFMEIILQMNESDIPISINKTVYEENGVNLMTAHSAKGLEFDQVFLFGCNTESWERSRGDNRRYSLPDTLTMSNEEDANKLESSRRLFYVAMTRARNNLQISFSAASAEGKTLEHSQFIAEIQTLTGIQTQKKHLPESQITDYLALDLTSHPGIAEKNGLEKSHLDQLLEKFEMTATHLNKYVNCQRAFYYESILKVPSARNEYTAYGTATHNTMKWLFDELKKNRNTFPSEKAFVEEFRKQLGRQRDAFTEIEFTNRLAYGEQSLSEYYRTYVKSWNKNALTEFTINNIEIEGVPCNGNLDKIEFLNEKEVNVVDYKTGNPDRGLKKIAPPSDKSPKGGDYWRQIVFYKLLLDNYRRQHWNMVSGEIDFLEKESGKNKSFIATKIPFTAEDINVVKHQIKEAYKGIRNHEFSMRCNEKDCRWCNFEKSLTGSQN